MQGKIEIQGSPDDLSISGVDFGKYVGTIEKKEQENDENLMQKTFDISRDTDEKQIRGVQMEASSKGKVKGSIAGNYFVAGANWLVLCLLVMAFIVVQLLASATDYWVSIW